MVKPRKVSRKSGNKKRKETKKTPKSQRAKPCGCHPEEKCHSTTEAEPEQPETDSPRLDL